MGPTVATPSFPLLCSLKSLISGGNVSAVLVRKVLLGLKLG